METYTAFENLSKLGQRLSSIHKPALPELTAMESEFIVTLPPSFKVFMCDYSDIYLEHSDWGCVTFAEMPSVVKNAREWFETENHLFPFVEDTSGDFFCFDTSSPGPEYLVRYWSHNGWSDEKWTDFPDWVEKCWIAGALQR